MNQHCSSFRTRPAWIAGLASLWLLMSGCAGQQPLTDPERDPWEGFNRNMHAFNMGVDKAIFRPVAKGYDTEHPRGLKKVTDTQ